MKLFMVAIAFLFLFLITIGMVFSTELTVTELLQPGSMNDLKITPGAARTNNREIICSTKTGTVRSVSSKVHKLAFSLYGLANNKTGWCAIYGCEVDHLISLELGGSNDIKNLWPQPYSGIRWNAHVKDKLENYLHKLICNRTLTPKTAQYAISHNWIAAYRKYIGELK